MVIVNGMRVKGSIYLDTSKKSETAKGIKRHNTWRASVFYDGKHYRMRAKDKEKCALFLLNLAKEHLALKGA